MKDPQIKEHINEVAFNHTQNLMTDEMNDAIERMDDIGHCWQLISDLTCSNNKNDDLNIVGRDNMASALEFLQREYWQASERLQVEMHKQLIPSRGVVR